MWPKALSQLIELAPHITRLAPLADRFLKDKATGDEATRQALDRHRASIEAQSATLEAQRSAVSGLSDRIHADLTGLVTQQTTQATALATLHRQVGDLEKHLVSTRADALAAKQSAEALEGHLKTIQTGQRRTQTLAIVAVALLVAILALIASLFLRVPR
jgi:chromosome segregation ATPase